MGNDNASGTLKLAVGLGITAIVLIIVVVAFNFGRNAANTAISNLSNETTQIQESRYTMYDGATITGSEVVNLISKFSNDNIYIRVKVNPVTAPTTAKNPSTAPEGDFYIFTDQNLTTPKDEPTKTNDLRLAQDVSDPNHYINPSSKFYGRVIRSSTTNGIMGIAFWRIS